MNNTFGMTPEEIVFQKIGSLKKKCGVWSQEGTFWRSWPEAQAVLTSQDAWRHIMPICTGNLQHTN